MANKSIQLTEPATYKILLKNYVNKISGIKRDKMYIENKDATGYNVSEAETDAWIFTRANILTDGYEAMRYLLTKYHIGNDNVSAEVSIESTVGTREDWYTFQQFIEKIKLVLNSIDLQFNNGEIV